MNPLRLVRVVRRPPQSTRGLHTTSRAILPALKSLAVRASIAAPVVGAAGYFVAKKLDPPGPHDYSVETEIGSVGHHEKPELAMDPVYKDLKDHAAPGGRGQTSTEEGTLVKVPILGNVKSTANPADRSITNQTQPDHMLHDGKVVRKVVLRDGKIYLQTVGTGNGAFPRLNEFFAKPLWNWYMARDLKKKFEKRHELDQE